MFGNDYSISIQRELYDGISVRVFFRIFHASNAAEGSHYKEPYNLKQRELCLCFWSHPFFRQSFKMIYEYVLGGIIASLLGFILM